MIVAGISSGAYEDYLKESLLDIGAPPSAANKYSECIQSEFLRSTQNTPAENFDVPEEELDQMLQRLWVQAAKTCEYSVIN